MTEEEKEEKFKTFLYYLLVWAYIGIGFGYTGFLIYCAIYHK